MREGEQLVSLSTSGLGGVFSRRCCFGLAAMPLWLPLALHGTPPEGAGFGGSGFSGLAACCSSGGLGLGDGVLFYGDGLYRRRCGACRD